MAARYYSETADDEREEGLLNYVKELVLKPFDILFSRTARRAYLTTFLAIFAATVLLGFATTAYTLFYWNYIPRIGFERTIHLQFDDVFAASDNRFDRKGNPHGTVSLLPDIVSLQRYDVSVELTLPRTRENRNAGNFMLEAAMFAPGTIMDPVKDTLVPGTVDADSRLAFSRRPAILAYRSLPVECLSRLIQLPWYAIGWRDEAEKLTITMWESVEFPRGWRNVPNTMRLDIQSTSRMQVYSAKAMFRARFRGLRWLMYNHRIFSAIIFIGGFWITEMAFAGLAWAAISYSKPPLPPRPGTEYSGGDAVAIKEEDADTKKLSDTDRTFPTSSKQQPLRYESPAIKQEDEDDAVVLPETSRATEADDEEEEDADVFIDSGLGTSMESSGRRDSMRRRRGRKEFQDGGE